jgi:hypothetical protein
LGDFYYWNTHEPLGASFVNGSITWVFVPKDDFRADAATVLRWNQSSTHWQSKRIVEGHLTPERPHATFGRLGDRIPEREKRSRDGTVERQRAGFHLYQRWVLNCDQEEADG